MVSCVSSPMATWSTLVLLLSVHLAMNHRAVRAVSMRSLNRQRANIVFSHLIQYDKILRPADVSARERIFERDGVLRWADDRIIGHGRIGVRMEELLQRASGSPHKRKGGIKLQALNLSELMELYADESFVLWFDLHRSDALIVLKGGCKTVDQLKAWAQALLLAQHFARQDEDRRADGDEAPRVELADLRLSLEKANNLMNSSAKRLQATGWDLDSAMLETTAGTRAVINKAM